MHDELATNHTDLRYQFTHGDVDRAFAEAAAVVEGEYRLNFVTPACLGTMVAIADWDIRATLTMWSTTQVPFLYQRDLAQRARASPATACACCSRRSAATSAAASTSTRST